MTGIWTWYSTQTTTTKLILFGIACAVVGGIIFKVL